MQQGFKPALGGVETACMQGYLLKAAYRYCTAPGESVNTCSLGWHKALTCTYTMISLS